MGRTGKIKQGKIKPKVIFGYLVVLGIALVALGITYKGFIDLTKTRQSISEPNQKLIKLNSILTDIYEAESNIRTYTLTQNESYLSIYVSFMSEINLKVDSLLTLAESDPVQSEKIKFIKELLVRKRMVLKELVELKRNDQSSRFYTMAMEEVEKLDVDSIQESSVVSSVTTTTTSRRDSTIKKTPEDDSQGVFSWFFRMFSKKEPVDTTITKLIVDVETKVDTLSQAVMSPSDSLLNEVVKILTEMKTQQEMTLYDIGEKELELLKSDKEIMDQIRTVVSLLEREELMNSYQMAEETNEVVGKLTQLLLVLGGTALFIIILFTAVIFRDLSRASYYRNQLYNAKQYAEKLLKVKEEFLANISHEIRTPLSAIIGFSRQLKKGKLNQQQELYVGSLYSSSQHLLQIVNDILDLSKIEEGYLRFESVPFSPHEIARDAVATFSLKAQEKGLELNLITESNEEIVVMGDPFRLRQILYNLISNGVKFTDNGSITVRIEEQEQANNSVTYHFRVIDTGIGIPQSKIDSIFNQFTQVDSSVSRTYGGTGLGLTIVKKLTELQGGELKVESQEEDGSEFSVKLTYPKSTGVLNKTEGDGRPENMKLPESLRVLAVDDDPTGQLLILEMLKTLGLKPIVLGNPKEALRQIKRSNYDVIFTDIQMPGISGYDLITAIRKMRKQKEPVVIALTANSVSSNPSQYPDAGFDEVLIKPINEVEIYNVLAPIVGYSTVEEVDESQADANEYDITDICRFADNDSDSIRTILQSFIDNANKNIADLTDFIKSEQWENVARTAHRMKSAFRQLKVNSIALTIEKLENYTENPLSSKEVEDALLSITKEVERVNRHLMEDIGKFSWFTEKS
ncbi:MAG: ATP-binding protein [Bacteroidales bacterium]